MNRISLLNVAACSIFAVVAATGCSGCSFSDPKVWIEDQRTMTLSPAQADTLKTLTRNGHVNIVADPAATDITVDVHIKAGGRDDADAADCLEAIDILTPLKGSTQHVEAGWKTTKLNHWGSSVSFDITAPPAMAVNVDTRNGAVGVENMTRNITIMTRNGKVGVHGGGDTLSIDTRNGAVDVESPAHHVTIVTRNGSIDARMTSSGEIEGRIETRNGQVNIDLADGASSEIHVNTRNGSIKTQANLANVQVEDDMLRGTLGAGGGQLSIETRNGSVTLH